VAAKRLGLPVSRQRELEAGYHAMPQLRLHPGHAQDLCIQPPAALPEWVEG
jgi:hypothetical protein